MRARTGKLQLYTRLAAEVDDLPGMVELAEEDESLLPEVEDGRRRG